MANHISVDWALSNEAAGDFPGYSVYLRRIATDFARPASVIVKLMPSDAFIIRYSCVRGYD